MVNSSFVLRFRVGELKFPLTAPRDEAGRTPQAAVYCRVSDHRVRRGKHPRCSAALRSASRVFLSVPLPKMSKLLPGAAETRASRSTGSRAAAWVAHQSRPATGAWPHLIKTDHRNIMNPLHNSGLVCVFGETQTEQKVRASYLSDNSSAPLEGFFLEI